MTERARLPSFRGLFVLLAGEAVQRLLSFVAIWLLTRRLAPEAFAPVEVTLATMMFAALAVEMGFPLFGAREVARDPAAVARLLPRALATQLAVALLLAVAAFAVARTGLVAPELAQLLPGYACTLLALPFFVSWVFQGLGRMEWVTLPGVLRQALFLVASALLVREAADVGRLPYAEAIAVAGAALAAQLAFRRRGGRLAIDPRGAFARDLVREAVPMGLSQLLWVLRMYLATLLLWSLVPKASVANFGVSHRVMMVLQALLTMYFTNLYPSLARAVRGPRAQLRALLMPSLLLTACASFAIASAFAWYAPVVLRLFRADYENPEAIACLKLLAFVLPVLALRGHARMTLLAMGRQKIELACSVAGTLLLAGLIPWWARTRGASGAALALLVAEGVGMVLTFLAFPRPQPPPQKSSP